MRRLAYAITCLITWWGLLQALPASAEVLRTVSGFSTDPANPTRVSGTIVLRGVPGYCPDQIVAESAGLPVELPAWTCFMDGYRLEWPTASWSPGAGAAVNIHVSWADGLNEHFYLHVRNARNGGRRIPARGVYVTNGWPDQTTGAPRGPGEFAFAEQAIDGRPLQPWVSGLAAIFHWRYVQAELGGPLDLTSIAALLDYARAKGRAMILIGKAGGNGSPPWLFAPPLSLTRLAYANGEPGLWQGGDRFADDLWTNVTAQIAAHFDDHDGFAGIYQAGAAAQYPEMFFGLPDGCLAPCTLTQAQVRDSYDWNGNNPASHGIAWADMAGRLSSQFQRGVVVNMLDLTYERPPAGPRQPTATALNAILDSEVFQALPAEGHAIGTPSLTLTAHEHLDRSPKYALLATHRPGSVGRVHEVDPVLLGASRYAAIGTRPAATDLETVIGYCDEDEGVGDRTVEASTWPVSCDQLIVHRQAVQQTPAYGPAGAVAFDPCTIEEVVAEVWKVPDTSPDRCAGAPAAPWTR